MRHNLTILLPVLALLASACGAVLGPTAQEATLQARNNELSTQITDLRATATVEVDRMMITVEHAQTEVNAVSQQRSGMRATQISRGTDATFFDANIPSESDLPTGVTPEGLIQPNLSGTTVQSAPPVTPPGGAPAANPAAAGQAVGTPTPPPQTGPRLTNATLTTAVGDDDCALNTSTSFPATTPEIYIVANAVEFPANTTVTTTWTREGEVMDSYDYTYDFTIEDACIWSFIDQTDFTFTPGNWTVQLQLSTGGGVGPIAFTITGDAAAAGADGAAGAADAGAPTGAPTAMTEGQ